jgi:hypothetical protein
VIAVFSGITRKCGLFALLRVLRQIILILIIAFFLEKYRDFLKMSDESIIYVKQWWPIQIGLWAAFEIRKPKILSFWVKTEQKYSKY